MVAHGCRFPDWHDPDKHKVRSEVDWLRVYAAKKGATPAQVSLAWLLAKGPNIVPIPGTRFEAHLLENIGAQRLKLTVADILEIDTILGKFPVFGDRMGEAHMSSIDYTV